MFEYEDEEDLLNPGQLPIYRQCREIFELCVKVADLIDDTNPMQKDMKALLLADAALLTVKVAGAEAGDLYDIRMENATLIRKAARDLITHCHSLKIFGIQEDYYFPLIRAALEACRHLFVAWVKTFDPWNSVPDRWGLFNPPGIEAEEED